MINSGGRHIHSLNSCTQISELLQVIFAGEIIAPSRCVWLISPWISDISVIDNRANTFVFYDGSLSNRKLRLSQVLGKILNLGTTVRIITRPVEYNDSFISRMKSYTDAGLPLIIKTADELHEKGLLGDYYYLSGSMNFTFSGISINQEAVYYQTNQQIVAENRIILSDRWGAEA